MNQPLIESSPKCPKIKKIKRILEPAGIILLWCIQSTCNQSGDSCEWVTSAWAAAKAEVVAEVEATLVSVCVLVDKHMPRYKR